MTNPRRRILLVRLRHQASGLVFLLVAALFFTVTIGIYRKAFTDTATVTLQTSFAGNQMRTGADVKIRGLVVGEVRSITSRGAGATLELAMQPERIDAIPANVSAWLLPKTLFGERYVALQPPDGAADRPIRAGDVITQDRSKNALELERVLDSLIPVLKAVQPQKLASTLNAVSTALDGKGEKLGETLVEFSRLVAELNPSLPDLKANLGAFTDVARSYSGAAPDLLDAMATLTTTSRTLVEKSADLDRLFATLTAASTDLTRFLRVNSDNIIHLTADAQSTMDILAKYAPQYPCMLDQFAKQIPEAEKAFGKGMEHPDVSRVKIEIISSRGPYRPGVDEPRYEDKRGPRCYPIVERPDHFPQYAPDGPLRDGSSKPPPPKKPDGSEADDYEDYNGGGGSAPPGVTLTDSAMEQDLIAVLAAGQFGGDPSKVPSWASVMLGPLYRGLEVELE